MLVDCSSLWCLQLLITLICHVRVAEVVCSTSLDLSMAIQGQRQGQRQHGLQLQLLHSSRVFPNVSLGLEPEGEEEQDHHQCKWDKRGLRFKGC